VSRARVGFQLAVALVCVAKAQALSISAPAAKAFDVTASRYQFDPAQIEVEEGDRVLLRLRSVDGPHGIAIKGVKAKAQILEDGTVVTLEFVAPKAGLFDFTCNEYFGPGHTRMRGRLVVKPKAS
jgi:cytochrome c oxidase subunit II